MNLLDHVQSELAKAKPHWKEIADELDYSYEFISRLGLGVYRSSPTIGRLQKIADHLKARRKKK